ATRVSLTAAALSWSAASDNVAVAGYRVYVNGLPIAVTTEQAVTITPLDPSIINTFTVQAFDASGNVSAGDPTAPIVLDNTPPPWPAASALEATVGADAVTFVWTAAIDDVGVDRYVLFEDALPVATVDGSTLTLALQLSGVSANAGHTFEIQALD